jgi:hypothetical protein
MKKINNLNNLNVISVNDGKFRENWELFLKNFSMYTYRYDLDYHEVIKAQIDNDFIDKSFIILKDNDPLAICPFVIDLSKKYAWYKMDHPLPLPLLDETLTSKQKINLEDYIFEICNKIIKIKNVVRWYAAADCLSFKNSNYYDLLADRHFFTDMSSYTRIVILENSKEGIWSQIRNSYRNIINRSIREIDFLVFDQDNFDGDKDGHYMNLHFKAAGRKTRSQKSFELMNELILKGKAILFVQKIKNSVVQMEIILLGKKTAYGGSVANDPDIQFHLPLTHSMNFFIFKELARRNFRFFEKGDTSYCKNIYNLKSQKQNQISFFKRGFGKNNTPNRKWILFLNNSEEKIFYQEQLNKLE